MNKLSKNLYVNHTTSKKIREELRGSIPSITELHEAAHRAEKKWLEADHKFIKAYNKYVVNSHLPDTFGEFMCEEISHVNIDPIIKQAYWKACWWGEDKEFHYPRKEAVAAMVFRCC